ncbi:SEED MATURATION PROTEIN 1 [Zingiber officinale]|nr:SEED MATURATION PROTEIN 1 [Zingiber officinale]
MAHSKKEIKYGTAQAKVSEDEAVRVAYKHGTPLETGKIADSCPVDLFVQAPRMAAAARDNTDSSKPPATDRDVDSKPEQAGQE